jgi:excisionase family DNA binding protein/YgiT-type zinc finger domain-containing protein
MKCHICGEAMHTVKGSVKAGWGDYKLIIEGVNLIRCEKCGEELLDTSEMRLVEAASRAFHESSYRPEILNVEEVADYLRVTPQTVYNMVKTERLRGTKIGREWRFRRDDVEAMICGSGGVLSLAARSAGSETLSENDRLIIQKHLKGMENEPGGGANIT